MNGEDILMSMNEIDNEMIASAAKGPAKKGKAFKKIIAAAACVAVILAVGVFAAKSGGLFGTLKYEIGTQNFEFKRGAFSASGGQSIVLDDETDRALTAEECERVFGADSSGFYAVFSNKTGKLNYAEGTVNGSKVCVSEKGKMRLDVIVEGSEGEQIISGEKVAAGYFITDANSRGERTAIFYARFEAGGMEYYIEKAGDNKNRDTVGTELAGQIVQIIENGGFDTDAVNK